MDCSRNCFHRLKESRLLLDFNIPAAVTVLLPLFMWLIAFLAGGNGADGADANQGGADQGQVVALGFVYFWSLLLFVGIVWYGNLVLENDNQELLKVLMAALVVFTNLSLMLAVLTGRVGVSVIAYCFVSWHSQTYHALDASFTRG